MARKSQMVPSVNQRNRVIRAMISWIRISLVRAEEGINHGKHAQENKHDAFFHAGFFFRGAVMATMATPASRRVKPVARISSTSLISFRSEA